MYRIFNGKTMQEFRDEQKKELIEKHRRREELEQKQLERIREEEEARKVPLHEKMTAEIHEIEKTAAAIQPGEIYAFSKLQQCFIRATQVIEYLLLPDPDKDERL